MVIHRVTSQRMHSWWNYMYTNPTASCEDMNQPKCGSIYIHMYGCRLEDNPQQPIGCRDMAQRKTCYICYIHVHVSTYMYIVHPQTGNQYLIKTTKRYTLNGCNFIFVYLRFFPDSHNFAYIMDETYQLKPFLFRMTLSDSLSSLICMYRIWNVDLQHKEWSTYMYEYKWILVHVQHNV